MQCNSVSWNQGIQIPVPKQRIFSWKCSTSETLSCPSVYLCLLFGMRLTLFPSLSPPTSVLSDFTPSWPTFGLNFWSVSFSGPQRAHSSSLMKPVGGFDLQIGSGLAEMVKINAFLKEICSFFCCMGRLSRLAPPKAKGGRIFLV